MNAKKFVGFLIMGAVSQEEAALKKGLVLWLPHKPSAWTRFWNRLLLKIYWVDQEELLEVKLDNAHTRATGTNGYATSIPRVKPIRKQTTDGKPSENQDTRRGSKSRTHA